MYKAVCNANLPTFKGLRKGFSIYNWINVILHIHNLITRSKTIR